MTLSQIQSKIYLLTKTNSTSFPNATMLILINNAYERVSSLIMSCDRRWQWDDKNNTDFPIATTNLIANQADYELSTTHLKIHRIEISVNSTASNWEVLKPYDQEDENMALTQLATSSGVPYRYDQIGASVILDPKPSYSCASGLKIYFQRGPTLFTSGDLSTGTALPGYNSLYHDLIPLWVAFDFGLANGKRNTNQLMAEIDRKEKMLRSDYVSRNREDSSVMSVSKINYI